MIEPGNEDTRGLSSLPGSDDGEHEI